MGDFKEMEKIDILIDYLTYMLESEDEKADLKRQLKKAKREKKWLLKELKGQK